MYLPKSKYEIKTAKAGEYTLRGQPFYGRYIETYKKQRFPGDKIENISATDEQLKPAESLGYEESPKGFYGGTKIQPTDKDYSRGLFIRYFQRDKGTGKVSEISEEQYKARKDFGFLEFEQITWALTGSIDNFYVGKYYIRGAKDKNLTEIERLSRKFPGVEEFVLTNPAEFVRETWK